VTGALMYAGLLADAAALARVEGIARWEEFGAHAGEIAPLLHDAAPVPQASGGREFLVEVRAHALAALQRHYRAARAPWDLGPVTVRAAMPVEEAVRRAAALRPAPPVLEAAERVLAARVRPFPRDRAACLAYVVLQELGEVAYETQEVDGRTWLTPLQQRIEASRTGGARPTPHLRFDGPDGALGYVYRAGTGWVLDFGESPAAGEVAAAVRLVRGAVRGGVPRIPPGGPPADGVVPDDGDPVEWLRSLAACLAARHRSTLVL
jgi:hypothetical protein